MFCRLSLLMLLLLADIAAASEPARSVRPLDGPWQFRRDAAAPDAWKDVTVPSAMQSHEGTDWHGVGWYRKSLDPLIVPAGRRLLLHFQAAATHAQVWWNGQKLGDHLGGWTPFRFDLTDAVRKAKPGAKHEILVRLDEKVGHNTQGFLPVIQPHFGGLWQGVSLLTVPETYIDDLQLSARGDVKTWQAEIKFPVAGTGTTEVSVGTRWKPLFPERIRKALTRIGAVGDVDNPRITVIGVEGSTVKEAGTTVPLTKDSHWSPDLPMVFEVEVRLSPKDEKAIADVVRTRVAFRTVEAKGPQLLLNGRPLVVRGVLNWGHYPPNLAPAPPEQVWRDDLKRARSLGFNLVKCCLWVPPKRLLEIADEEGVLVWMEYPTWRPNFGPDHLPALTREFEEFFAFDRNHPSVILRSLTCETGQTADVKVIRDLYDRCKRMAPGGLVVDDSSWIDWIRVFDFYDDHTYGNNHTWVANLHRLRDHIAKSPHGEKPLLLGEAIGADTWTPFAPLAAKIGDQRPWWLPGFFDANRQWLERMRAIAGPIDEARLVEDSKRYALLMRKYQIETFRREHPGGGYVVGVWRDFPLSAMGLVDYLGQLKWKPEEWRWHGDVLLVLQTEGDRRSFTAGEKARIQVLVSNFGSQALPARPINLTLVEFPSSDQVVWMDHFRSQFSGVGPGGSVLGLEDNWQVPNVNRPMSIWAGIDVKSPPGWARNEWRLWAVPGPQPRPNGVTIVRRLDPKTLDLLEAGGKVLLLPDGGPNSPRLRSHWFMRGGPFVADHPALKNVPRDLIIDTQHFDLAGDVIPDVGYLDQIDPIVMLWENHDIKEVRTHGLVFETRVGKGRLLVSALKHDGPTNAAGRYLLDEFLKHLATGPEPRHALSDAARAGLRRSVEAGKIDLVGKPWRFRPDPADEGLKRGWHRPDFKPDGSWKPINIDRHWERQGFPLLDGWAWYRLEIPVPADWAGREVYVTFEGVDDYYELFVNGTKAGHGGDLEKRIYAFHEKKSHRVTPFVKAGEPCAIAVRVNDWYGGGGIFRPVTLATVPYVAGEPEIVR